jgi:hypothetical protein
MVMEEDQIAGPNMGHAIADGKRAADNLVTEHCADFLRQVPRHQVARADAARHHPGQQVAIALEARHRRLDDLELLGASD